MYFLASEGYDWTVIITIVRDTKGYLSSLFGIKHFGLPTPRRMRKRIEAWRKLVVRRV